MQIQVKGFLTFRELLGTRTIEIDEQTATLRDCLQVLATEIGEGFQTGVLDVQGDELRPHVALLLNGQHYRHLENGLDTQVKDGDQLAIFPPVAGG